VWGNFNDLIYFSTKIFFKSILSIFFSSIEVSPASCHSLILSFAQIP
jgi:hypothetical protein